MLASHDSQWLSLSDFDHRPVAETGHTFRANACLKASGYALQSGHWTLADDSGLEVDALGGAPGVFSARWAQSHAFGRGDADNNALLLKQIETIDDAHRTGRFVCVLALADPKGRIVLTGRDTIEGIILRAPRGENGFGYDPLFFAPEAGATTAELLADEKHRISHRGKALRRLRALMNQAGLS
jgi:XTP/dITP diphosphohydrolase